MTKRQAAMALRLYVIDQWRRPSLESESKTVDGILKILDQIDPEPGELPGSCFC